MVIAGSQVRHARELALKPGANKITTQARSAADIIHRTAVMLEMMTAIPTHSRCCSFFFWHDITRRMFARREPGHRQLLKYALPRLERIVLDQTAAAFPAAQFDAW